ncbi:MAG: CapA family protein [Clostridiales bacterium]|nr:CapA family protein [Clostridiales bacterium]
MRKPGAGAGGAPDAENESGGRNMAEQKPARRRREKRRTEWKAVLASVMAAVVVLTVMAVSGGMNQQPAAVDVDNPEIQTAEPVAEDAEVTLIAVGDNLIHNTILDAGKQADGSYSFESFYTHMKPYVSQADIAVINQETILGGDVAEPSGYPLFNSPWEIGEAAIATGFNVFLNATNHAMDMRSAGILRAIDFYDQHPEVTYLGINRDSTEYGQVKVVEKNGIKIAMLNYTYGTNGIAIDADKSWIVNLIDKEKMAADIQKAREAADVVVVFPHWGTEYSQGVSAYQEDLTEFFLEQGVDLVIGSHPHVIEPVEWVERSDGHSMLVYYSLGNFISHQNGADRMLGAMANVTIRRTDGEISIAGNAVPIVTHVEKVSAASWTYGVYALEDYTDALAARHKESKLSLDYLHGLADEVLGDFHSLKQES